VALKLVEKRNLEKKCVPGGTIRNYDSYGHKIMPLTDEQRNLLCDPQTSGGLLVAVENEFLADFLNVCKAQNLDLQSFGSFKTKGEFWIEVE
jgi:selenide, water dikinase